MNIIPHKHWSKMNFNKPLGDVMIKLMSYSGDVLVVKRICQMNVKYKTATQ